MIKKHPIFCMALLLFLALPALLALVTDIAGGILSLMLAFVTALAGLLLLGIVRIWRAGRRKWVNRVRIGVLGMLLLLVCAGFLYGVLSIYRFSGDQQTLGGQDRYVAIIVADGASLLQAKALLMKGLDDPDQYADAFNRNFPHISSTFLTRGAFTANGIAVWPSSSVPAHTGILTGAYPRRTGVMGQRQFDPITRRYTSYIGLGILRQRQILARKVKTLYEHFPHSRSVAVLQVVNRGCSLYVPGTPHDEQVALRTCQVVRYADLLGRLTKRPQIPRILVVTLPGIDHLTHNSLLSDEKSMRAYLDTDRYLGEIFTTYRRAGIFDKTLFVLAADHGMGEVTHHVTLDNLMHDLRFTTYESFKWSLVPAWGSFEANALLGTPRRFDTIYNALPLWGGNSDALIYIKGQKSNVDGMVMCENWRIRTGDDWLKSYQIGGTRINVIERLLAYSPGIGLIFTNPERNTFNIYGHGGQGQIRERIHQGHLQFHYRLINGRDPLGYMNNPTIRPYLEQGSWLSDQQWASLTYLEHYPDALRRIAYSLQTPNAGTMHIVAADGWDFTPYYVAKRVLVGSHGSLNAQHSLVPIMFYGPGVKHVELPYARTVDIVPTILHYLGADAENIDGRPLPIFTDGRENLRIAEGTAYVMSRCEDDKAVYELRNSYASYDQQLVRIDKGTGKVTVLVASTKRAMPELSGRVDCEARLIAIQYPRLLLRQHFAGEGLAGDVFRYTVK